MTGPPSLDMLLEFYNAKDRHPDQKMIIAAHSYFLNNGYLVLDGEQKTEFFTFNEKEDDPVKIQYTQGDVKLETSHSFVGDLYYITYKYAEKPTKSSFELKLYLKPDGELQHVDELMYQIHDSVRYALRQKQKQKTKDENKLTTQQKQAHNVASDTNPNHGQ